MDNENYIATDTCDTCGRRGPTLVMHHLGSPVLSQCQGCQPEAFESQAREDINAWLSGGPSRIR